MGSLMQALFGLIFGSVGVGIFLLFRSEASKDPLFDIFIWFPCVFIAVGALVLLGAFHTAIKNKSIKRNQLSLEQAIDSHRDEVELSSQSVVYDEMFETHFIEGEYVDKNHITYLYRFGYEQEKADLLNILKNSSEPHIVIDYTDPQNCKILDTEKFEYYNKAEATSSFGPVVGTLIAAVVGGLIIWLSYAISRLEGYMDSGQDVSEYGVVSTVIAVVGALVLFFAVLSAFRKLRRESRYAKSSSDLKISKVEIYPELAQNGAYPRTVVEVEYDGDDGRRLCRTQPMHCSVLAKLNYQGSLRGKVYLDDNECVLR